jgi:hypothetical protein
MAKCVRVFGNHKTSTIALMAKIKEEAVAWTMEGAKDPRSFAIAFIIFSRLSSCYSLLY